VLEVGEERRGRSELVESLLERGDSGNAEEL